MNKGYVMLFQISKPPAQDSPPALDRTLPAVRAGAAIYKSIFNDEK